jgi:superfamily II DNA or RNA helicase
MISFKKPESKQKLPSAIIDSRGYVLRKKIVSKELEKLIQDELIVKPELNNDFGQSDYFKVYTEDDENFYLPKFWAQENIGVEAQINLSHKKKYIAEIKFKGLLRSSQSSPQIEVIESMLDIFYDPITNRLKPWASSIISIRTGGGKTVLGLFMACFIGYRTVIFCHNSSLFDQWIERIEEYVDGARIGWIRGDKVKISGCNIVIAMIQTVMTGKKDYEKILSGFNFAIYDECHHLGAKVFSKSLIKVQAPYYLGLSATPERKDNLDKVFKYFLGEI